MTQRIGVRELREKLSSFLEASEPIEVTRHGQTIGFFIPIPRRMGQAEREALLEAGRRLDEQPCRINGRCRCQYPHSRRAGEPRETADRA
jgi:antitoxin (DNA-binding transcriptional repressor) of toxin-antitoxin stability system